MTIRALGIITDIDADGFTVYVKWVLRIKERIVPLMGCVGTAYGPYFTRKDAAIIFNIFISNRKDKSLMAFSKLIEQNIEDQLRSSLKLTPKQRLVSLDKLVKATNKLRKAGIAHVKTTTAAK